MIYPGCVCRLTHHRRELDGGVERHVEGGTLLRVLPCQVALCCVASERAKSRSQKKEEEIKKAIYINMPHRYGRGTANDGEDKREKNNGSRFKRP